MKKLLLPVLLCAFILVTGCAAKNIPVDNQPKPQIKTSLEIIYRNEQYGFTLNLPKTWEGYSVSTSSVAAGQKIVIRQPKWTKDKPYEDIPVLVYSLAQWQKWEANNFADYQTAAPIGPTERGRNESYVFATAPRYNFDFLTGFEEVETIISGLKTFSPLKINK